MPQGEGTLHCQRCDDAVPVLRPWRGWKPAWTAWKVFFVVALAAFPLLASDFCIMLPSLMLYIVAGGPLRSFAKQAPVCLRCSAELVDAPPLAPTPRPAG